MLSQYLPTKPAFRLESLARASRNHLPHNAPFCVKGWSVGCRRIIARYLMKPRPRRISVSETFTVIILEICGRCFGSINLYGTERARLKLGMGMLCAPARHCVRGLLHQGGQMNQEMSRYTDTTEATRSSLRTLWVGLVAAATLAWVGAASGAPIPFVNLVVSCEATVQGGPGGGASDCASTSVFGSPTSITASDSVSFSMNVGGNVGSGSASASYAATADFGHLGIGFDARAVSDAWSNSGCGSGGICSGSLASAFSFSNTQFADYILVQSSTLAVGTPITIAFAMPLLRIT